MPALGRVKPGDDGSGQAASASPFGDVLDLGVGREPAELGFGEFEGAVDGDLEHAAARSLQFDRGAGQFTKPRSRTESPGLVASLSAIGDDDFHRSARADVARESYRPRVGKAIVNCRREG